MTSRRLASLVASALVTVGVFASLLSQVSPGAVIELVAGADRGAVAMFVVLSLAMSALRTWRYRLFLAVAGFRPPLLPLFLIVLVRNLFVDLLPARLGSLVYVYLVREKLGVPLASATSSFGLSLVFDVVAQAPILLVAILLVGDVEGISTGGLAAVGLAVAGAGFLALALLPRLLGVARPLARPLGQALAGRWEAFLDRIRGDVEATAAGGVYSRALLVSMLIRLAKYGGLYVFLYALLAPRGYGVADLDVAKVLIGTMAAEAAASLPVSGLAGFGAYEGAWAAVFQLLGFPGEVAKLTSLAHHLFTQAWGYALGAAAGVILLLPMPSRDDSGGKAPLRPAPWSLFSLQIAGAVAGIVGLLLLAHGLFGSSPAATASEAPGPAAAPDPALARLAAVFPQRIVFDSDRSGTFGVHSIRADGGDLRPIVDGPAHEMFPDPSPDGDWVVFARTASTWRLAPAEVWIARADGSEARKLADDGTFPTFSSDGRTVYFERGRAEVWSVPRDGGEPRRLFDPERFGFAGREIVKPRISPDGSAVVFTSDRDGRWNAWGVDLRGGSAFHVGIGCEPAWPPELGTVAWIRERDARGGSGIFLFDRATRRATEIQDGGAPLDTEYFPTITADGRFLLYGAASERERSHVDGAFSLFVKDLETKSVYRLTADAHVNRWPKPSSSAR